jgi:protein TonB
MSPAAQSTVPGELPGGAEPVSPFSVPTAGTREGMPLEQGISAGGPEGGAVTRLALPPAYAFVGGGDGSGGAEIRRLRERIESRIVYPEDAIRRGQEGEVLLRIRVGEGGVPQEIRVARSSGARTLDDAARSGVARAAPLPSLPGWFEVPIRFSLR